MSKAALTLSVILMCAMFLVGCGGGGGGSSGGGSTATGGTTSSASTGGGTSTQESETPTEPVKESIVYHLNATPQTLDPPWCNAYEWEITHNIYDTLFRPWQMDFGNIVPWLVEEYEFSDDFLDLRCKIKEGVKFHNGDELTSADVAFTIDAAKESGITAPTIVSIDTVEIIDDYNFIIKQNRPYPNLLAQLGQPHLGIKNKALYEEYGAHAREAVVGTGPYKLVEWPADNNIKLEYVGDYWGGEPVIKEVTFRPIPDINAAVIAFESGELDVFNWASATDADYLMTQDQYDHVVIYRSTVQGVSMNNQHPAFSQVNVRRAVNYALDNESINMIVTNGANNPEVWTRNHRSGANYDGVDLVKYDYDLDKAKALLADEGYDENNPLKASFISTTSPVTVALSTAIQDALAKANIQLDIETMEISGWWQRLTAGDFETAYATWSFEWWIDAILYYVSYHSGMFYNFEKTTIPEVDELATSILTEMDTDKRTALENELLHVVTDQATCAPIYQVRAVCFSTKGLVLFPDEGSMITPVWYMYWDNA